MRTPLRYAVLALVVGCSSSSDDPDTALSPDAGDASIVLPSDAAIDLDARGPMLDASGMDARVDAASDASLEAGPANDAARDAGSDAGGDAALIDAGSDTGVTANSAPIDIPAESWVFLPIEGMVCGDGSPTGIGINRSTTSTDLTINLAGGGACWDGDTCFSRNLAVHVAEPYDEALFRSEFLPGASPNRDPNNPASRATQVFVPYCTGDLHGGDAVRDYATAGTTRKLHHVGARNMALLLARLYAGLPTPETIYLFGSSAGGYGSQLNLRPTEAAFPSATVHMLSDSGPLITPQAGLWDTWRLAWNLQFPAECSACPARFGALIDVLAEDDRHGRIGLMAFEQDAIIAAYFGYTGATEQTALRDLVARSYMHEDTRYFLARGTDHVLISRPATRSPQSNVLLNDWLLGYLGGGPTWVNAP